MKKVFFFLSLYVCGIINALPLAPFVSQGTAFFDSSESKMLTITASDRSHMFWKNFSIAEDEVVRIVQPSSDSILVIQVESDLPSSIMGNLVANGHLCVINSNGITIGARGTVNANDFLATTLSVCPCSFLEQQDEISFRGESTAMIVNKGRIKAETNNVFLIAYQIENHGAIDATSGTVALAAGTDIALTQLQTLTIASSVIKDTIEETGIDNAGMINARKIDLIADGHAYELAIRHAGLINAIGEAEHPCSVHLHALGGYNGIFGGISAENVGGIGGLIHVFGQQIAFFESSTLDVSGDFGGGTILIGGDQTSAAQTIFIDGDVLISADALQTGTAGNIKLEADERTVVHGTFSICGEGGTVEMTGMAQLDFQGVIERENYRAALLSDD